jgi:hypothetical protein
MIPYNFEVAFVARRDQSSTALLISGINVGPPLQLRTPSLAAYHLPQR